MSKEKFTTEELNINKELEAAGFEPIGPSEEVVAEKEPSRGLPEGFDPNSMSFNIETPDNSVSPTSTHDNAHLDEVKEAEEMFGPVEPRNSHEHTPNVDFRSKEEIYKVLKMSPKEIIRRKTEKIEREAEKTQTPKDDSIDNCCKYRIRKEKPGYYNDGDGSVSIECLEDCSKNLKIVQQNCVINNQQIVNIYDYVQQNPGITSPRVTKSFSKEYEGEDNEFSVHFLGKDSKKITINLADLPKAKNVELMKSLTAVSSNNLSRGGRL